MVNTVVAAPVALASGAFDKETFANGFWGSGAVISITATSLFKGLGFYTERTYPDKPLDDPTYPTPNTLKIGVYDYDTRALIAQATTTLINWGDVTFIPYNADDVILQAGKKYIIMCSLPSYVQNSYWRLLRSRDVAFPKLFDGLVYAYANVRLYREFEDFWISTDAPHLLTAFQIALAPLTSPPSNPTPSPPPTPTHPNNPDPDPDPEPTNPNNNNQNNQNSTDKDKQSWLLFGGLAAIVIIALILVVWYFYFRSGR